MDGNKLTQFDEAVARRHWMDCLRTTSKGAPVADEANVIAALRNAPQLKGIARFNEFAGRAEVARRLPWRESEVGERWTDGDDLNVAAWLQSEVGMPVRGKGSVAESVAFVAKDNSFHPVKDYLDGLEWDEKPRLQTWLFDHLGSTASPQYLAAVGQAFLISAVARIYEPGCQVDHALVFEGVQGIGKSSAFRALGHPWTADSLPDMSSKDAEIQLDGVWLVEVSELSAMRGSSVEQVKQFISRRVGLYRPPYGRHTIEMPRQCVFIATTNESEYLRDTTGNRRFWPVKVGKRVDVAALSEARDQLWAEAVQLYREGEPWHLSNNSRILAEIEQTKRLAKTEAEAAIVDYLLDQRNRGSAKVTSTELYHNALGIDPDEKYASTAMSKNSAAVARGVALAGWKKSGTQRDGRRRAQVYIDGNPLES